MCLFETFPRHFPDLFPTLFIVYFTSLMSFCSLDVFSPFSPYKCDVSCQLLGAVFFNHSAATH